MGGLSISKTAAIGLGLALLVGQGARAQSQVDLSSSPGGFDARAVAASENAYRLRDRMEAALGHDSERGWVVSLAMTPGREGRQLCGMAVTSGRYTLFHVTDTNNVEGTLSLTQIPNTLNGLAVAHNEIYARCGGVGKAVFVIENREVLG